MDEKRLELSGSPAEDIDWCHARGYRAYVVGAGMQIYRPAGVLITRDAQVIGVAEAGDTLVYDGVRLSIRPGER